MWGIFIGSLLFVWGMAMLLSPNAALSAALSLLIAAGGMTLALMATGRYVVDLIGPPVPAKKTIYDDMGTEPALPEQPAA